MDTTFCANEGPDHVTVKTLYIQGNPRRDTADLQILNFIYTFQNMKILSKLGRVVPTIRSEAIFQSFKAAV